MATSFRVGTWPSRSVDLVALLDDLVPDKCPTIEMTEREIWMYAGKRELVQKLIQEYLKGR